LNSEPHLELLLLTTVTKVSYEGREYYACDICGLVYQDYETAIRCENFCRRFKACFVEISSEAVGRISKFESETAIKLFRKSVAERVVSHKGKNQIWYSVSVS